MSKKNSLILKEISEFLDVDEVINFRLKGGKSISCVIYKKRFKADDTDLRIQINFLDTKIESFRIGLNHLKTSKLYNDFIQWDFAKYIYMDDSYQLEENKIELNNITVFQDERFQPVVIKQILPKIKNSIKEIIDNESFLISEMKRSLSYFSFENSFYKDESVNFLIRCFFYWKTIGISFEDRPLDKYYQRANAHKGQPGSLFLNEFFEYLDTKRMGHP